jgi:hypothetical protein
MPNQNRAKSPTHARERNGSNRRVGLVTPRQRELREKAFYLHIEGHSYRAIGQILEIHPDTAGKYVRAEYELRVVEFDKNRDEATFRAWAFYESVKRRAIKRAEAYDAAMGAGTAKGLSDNSFMAALKAQERIDKILGVDSPSKLDDSLRRLAEALQEPDDPSRPLT